MSRLMSKRKKNKNIELHADTVEETNGIRMILINGKYRKNISVSRNHAYIYIYIYIMLWSIDLPYIGQYQYLSMFTLSLVCSYLSIYLSSYLSLFTLSYLCIFIITTDLYPVSYRVKVCYISFNALKILLSYRWTGFSVEEITGRKLGLMARKVALSQFCVSQKAADQKL